MQDGSCVCDQGWTGLDCSIECLGGHESPCSFNGECQMDGSCEFCYVRPTHYILQMAYPLYHILYTLNPIPYTLRLRW